MDTNNKSAATLSGITLRFSLPADFGKGWEYDQIFLFGTGHAYAGSYNRSENGNFALEALLRIAGLTSSSLYVGTSCTVEFDVDGLEKAPAILERLNTIVAAFPIRKSRQITVRGSNYWDSKVTEYAPDNQEQLVVNDMPLRAYLAKKVPMSNEHPSLKGEDLNQVLAEYGIHP